MPTSKIEWLRDPTTGKPGYTINPVKGLCPMACSYCYARRLYKRFKWNPEVRWCPQAFHLLDKIKKPSRIFVGSTFELFHESLPENWMDYNLGTAKKYPQHTFIFLTKKPAGLLKWSPFPRNTYVGVSVTDQEQYAKAIHYLKDIQATIKFISFEPLLDLEYGLPSLTFWIKEAGINWLIIGQQTPVSAKTAPKIEWIKEIVEAGTKAGIRVFMKDNLGPLIESYGMLKCSWAAKEWVQCKYPILRQEYPKERTIEE